MAIENSIRIKKFIGRTVKKITKDIYLIITNQASFKNLYTYEISESGSKAAKILWGGDDIIFDDEEIVIIEALVFLMNTKESGLMDFIKKIKPLPIDPAYDSDCLQLLLRKRSNKSSMLMDEIESCYENIDNISERIEMIKIIKNPDVDFG